MKPKASIYLVDPAVVRHRRLELGLTESYLGALCQVTSSVIRRIELGYPQDDLSARFLHSLAANLGTTLADLLVTGHRDIDEEPEADDARVLGATLLAVDEPVPVEAICEVFDWTLDRLDTALDDLAERLEPAGGAIVENCAMLSIIDDLAPVDRATIDAISSATFARRRPNLKELRAIHQLAHDRPLRHEGADTATARALGRLRNLGLLARRDTPKTHKSDPPELHDDVRYSLMLDSDL